MSDHLRERCVYVCMYWCMKVFVPCWDVSDWFDVSCTCIYVLIYVCIDDSWVTSYEPCQWVMSCESCHSFHCAMSHITGASSSWGFTRQRWSWCSASILWGQAVITYRDSVPWLVGSCSMHESWLPHLTLMTDLHFTLMTDLQWLSSVTHWPAPRKGSCHTQDWVMALSCHTYDMARGGGRHWKGSFLLSFKKQVLRVVVWVWQPKPTTTPSRCGELSVRRLAEENSVVSLYFAGCSHKNMSSKKYICVCACVRIYVCVCVWKRQRRFICVRVREREREKVCIWVYGLTHLL